MALTIAIGVATLAGYVVGFVVGRAYWTQVGVRLGSAIARSATKVVWLNTESPVVELEAKLLRAQSDLVRLEFKCTELAAQLKAKEHEQVQWTNKSS